MRKLLLGVAILIGAVLTGLLLASLLLKQECPDCSGTTRYLNENPSQCIDGPAILDCPRCADTGRVSLFNGRVGPSPDPLMANVMRNSNRESWRSFTMRKELVTRLKQSPLRRASGGDWGAAAAKFGRSRFLRDNGKTYVLHVMEEHQCVDPADDPLQVYLFDARGMLLDALYVTAREGASRPQSKFIIPVDGNGACADITLLNWANKPCKSVEIDHAGKLWKDNPAEPREKLDQMKWKMLLRNGRLQIVDAAGKSIAD